MASMSSRYLAWSRRGAGLVVGEAETVGVGVDDGEGIDEALSVLVELEECGLAGGSEAAFESAGGALEVVDALGLLSGLADGEDEASVLEFLVDIGGGGGEEDHDGSLHLIVVSDEASCSGVLSGGGDAELALALEEFQCVAGALGAFFFHDGEDLVGQVGLAHVEEGLAGECGELDPILGGDEIEDGVHEGGLAGSGGGLHDEGQGAVEFSADGGDVAQELVGLFADDACGLEVGEDAIDEAGVTEELEGGGAFFVTHGGRCGGLGLQRFLDQGVLQVLECEEECAQVVVDEVGGDAELGGGGLLEGDALSGLEEIEGVGVEAGIGAHPEVDAEESEGSVGGQSPNSVGAVAAGEGEGDGVGVGIEGGCWWRARWWRKRSGGWSW